MHSCNFIDSHIPILSCDSLRSLICPGKTLQILNFYNLMYNRGAYVVCVIFYLKKSKQNQTEIGGCEEKSFCKGIVRAR
jgi:hypothetical protein